MRTIATNSNQIVFQKTGLRIRGEKGHPEVRRALIKFARWVRKQKDFPIRLNVYLFQSEHIVARDGDKCMACIWIPFDSNAYPYIRIATGDFEKRKKRDGRDNALASDLCTFCHELIHYWQWIDNNDTWENGVARQASKLVHRYAGSTDHP